MKRRYFEDLKEGEQLSCTPIVFTKHEIIEFANRFDPWPFHTDEEAARSSIFGEIIASSLHTISACTRVVVDALRGLEVITGLGIDEVKLPAPVRPGDTLFVEASVEKLRRSRRNLERGILSVKCRVKNEEKIIVAEYGYRYMVACKDRGG
jgi:acyl dehydratase